jgi:hypothetical protein
MNIKNCKKWLKNKNINPITNGKIQFKKATYNKIEKECNEIMNKKKKPKMDENTAAKKITKLFKPLLHKYSGDINDRIDYYKIIHKYLKEYNEASNKNCLKNYNKELFRIGKRIIIDKKLGEGVYGIVFNGYFRPDIKNKKYGKALKLAIKLSNYTLDNQREAKIYSKISKYVITNKCPHFSIFYGLLICISSLLGLSNEIETSSLINSKSNKSLNINLKDYKNVDLFKNKEYFLTLTELADGTLFNFIYKTNNEKILFNSIIQCLISIVFFHKLMRYSHNDAHFNNYLIHNIKPGGYFHYNIYGVDYYLKNLGFLVILNDFGLIEDLTIKNVYIDFNRISTSIRYKIINEFIENNILNVLNANAKAYENKNKKTFLDYFIKRKPLPEPEPLSLEEIEDKVYPNIFKELSKTFSKQLLTKKPDDVIINKIPYVI